MSFLGRLIWRTAVRRGVFGGQRAWLTVLAVAGAVKAFRRIAGGTSDVVYLEELSPGQALIVTHHQDLRLGDGA